VFAHCLTHEGILKAIREQVRFARARMGTYELMDFVAVVIGYVLSGEPTPQTFYERLAPFAEPFMSLFERNQLPHRSTLSRFLAALDQPTVEALRMLFQEDLLARTSFASPGGLFDRTGGQWTVMDVDSTRCVARQRAAAGGGAARASSSFRSGLCAGLSRPQAGRGCAYADGDSPGAYPSISRHVRWIWEWGLSR